ncbi:NAD-dependent epimerase [Allostella vacuolata]|nr:NAD-dependent epimerase [Stella vacuolata]
MTILVAGSAGHLGEAVMRVLRASGRPAIGIDARPSPFTDHVGSITDRAFLRTVLQDGVRSVIHAAALHKPHVVTHPHQAFVEVNLGGTLALLESASDAGVGSFVFTSTTSAFGSALAPAPGLPAAWITEDVAPVPRNIYGTTKLGAEHLCEMFARRGRLAVVVLRTSRFFPEEDDAAAVRNRFDRDNAQLNELLYRRVDLEDAVQAHLLAVDRAPGLGFARFIVSAPSPFRRGDLAALRRDPAAVVWRRFPAAQALYAARGWSMFDDIDRVYVSRRAVAGLGWAPRWGFAQALRRLRDGEDFRSPLARAVGRKGYHAGGPGGGFADGPYPVEA